MSLEAKITVDSSQVEPALRNVERRTSRVFRQIGTAMQRGTASVNGMVTSFRSLAFSAGGIGIAVGLAFTGIVIAAKRVMTVINNIATRMKDIRDGAARSNLNVKEYQKLTFVANTAGVSLNRLTSLYEKLNKAIENGKNGQKQYLDFFKSLKVSILDLEGLDPTEMFDKITKSMRANNIDPSTLANAQSILGKSGVADLNRLGSFDINGLTKQAEASNLVVDKSVMDTVIRFKQSMNESSEAIMNSVIQMDAFQKAMKSLTKTISKTDKPPEGFTTYNAEIEKMKAEAKEFYNEHITAQLQGRESTDVSAWEKAGMQTPRIQANEAKFVEDWLAYKGGERESELAKQFGTKTFMAMKANPDAAYEIPNEKTQAPKAKPLDSAIIGSINRTSFSNGKFSSSSLLGQSTDESFLQLKSIGNAQLLDELFGKVKDVNRPELAQSTNELKSLMMAFNTADINGEDTSELKDRMLNLVEMMKTAAYDTLNDIDMADLLSTIKGDIGDLNDASNGTLTKHIDAIKNKLTSEMIDMMFTETLDPKSIMDAIASYNGKSTDDYIKEEIETLVGSNATEEMKQKALEEIFSFDSIRDRMLEFADLLKKDGKLDMTSYVDLLEKAMKDVENAEEKYFKSIVNNLDKSMQAIQKATNEKKFKKNRQWDALEEETSRNMLKSSGLNNTEVERVMGLYKDLKAGKNIGYSGAANTARKLLESNNASAESRKFDANEAVSKRFNAFRESALEANGYGRAVARNKALEEYANARQMNVSSLSNAQKNAISASVNYGFDLEELKKRLSMSFSPIQIEQNELAQKGGFTSYVRTKEDDRWKENLFAIKTLQDKMNINLANIAQHTKALEGN